MLFGRGSSGGAVNQVSKAPRLIDEHQVDLPLGSRKCVRATGDFNIKTGEGSALRLNAMATKTDNNGADSSLDNFGPDTVFACGNHLKVQDMENLYAQTDYNTKFEGLRLKHAGSPAPTCRARSARCSRRAPPRKAGP